MAETTKLLGSTKRKITKDKNCGNVPHLEITEFIVILSTMIINKILESCIHLFQVNHLVNY